MFCRCYAVTEMHFNFVFSAEVYFIYLKPAWHFALLLCSQISISFFGDRKFPSLSLLWWHWVLHNFQWNLKLLSNIFKYKSHYFWYTCMDWFSWLFRKWPTPLLMLLSSLKGIFSHFHAILMKWLGELLEAALLTLLNYASIHLAELFVCITVFRWEVLIIACVSMLLCLRLLLDTYVLLTT